MFVTLMLKFYVMKLVKFGSVNNSNAYVISAIQYRSNIIVVI